MIWGIHYFITKQKTKIDVFPRSCFNNSHQNNLSQRNYEFFLESSNYIRYFLFDKSVNSAEKNSCVCTLTYLNLTVHTYIFTGDIT